MQQKSLYRNRLDTIIGGVAGGIGKYLNLDPTFIRILFVILAIAGGGGLLIYVILWVALPLEPIDFNSETNEFSNMENKESTSQNQNDQFQGPPGQPEKPQSKDGNLIAGVILIAIGAIFLINRFARIDFGDLWPFILLVAGIVLVIRGYSKTKDQTKSRQL